jgi:hypothetical protein
MSLKVGHFPPHSRFPSHPQSAWSITRASTHKPPVHGSSTGIARGGTGPLDRCALIRNQIAIARSRDSAFAIQFFDRFGFFMSGLSR